MTETSNGGRGKGGMERLLGRVTLAIIGILCLLVVKPFASALIWAVLLGYVLYPVQKRFTKWFKGRETLAALAVTSLTVLVVVLPISLIGLSLVDDTKRLAVGAKESVMEAPEAAPKWLTKVPYMGGDLESYWHDFTISREKWSGEGSADGKSGAPKEEVKPTDKPASRDRITEDQAGGKFQNDGRLDGMLDRATAAIRNLIMWTVTAFVTGATQIAISLFLVFFILKDLPRLSERLHRLSTRVAGERGGELLEVAGQTVKGVVYGFLGTSAAQAIMAGIGFLIAGVPGAILLGALTFFVAVIPIGPPVIWGGAAAWLFMRGETGMGIFMVIWGLIAISSIDNVIRPILVSNENEMPFALMFFGLVGGAVAFGLIGVFLGPMLLAVAYRLVEQWTADRGKPGKVKDNG